MKKYFAYLSKVHNQLKKLSERKGISLWWLYQDYFKCLLHYGCLINQYVNGDFYKMGVLTRKRSFTQRRLEKVIQIANDREYTYILVNKLEFNTFFKDYIEREWLYSRDMNKDSFKKLIESNHELFIKPLSLQEGEGIRKVRVHGENVNQLYEELTSGSFLIETVIKQHPLMYFNNTSVNSARILTVLDKSGKAHIIRAGLRVGVGDSVVDNYSAGGVLYEIDLSTGIIDHKGIKGGNYNLIYHPGSNKCLLGFQIPNWELAINVVKTAAEKIPQCRFIGWDVAFTEKGVELIEGNHNPGIFTLESTGSPGAYFDVIRALNA